MSFKFSDEQKRYLIGFYGKGQDVSVACQKFNEHFATDLKREEAIQQLAISNVLYSHPIHRRKGVVSKLAFFTAYVEHQGDISEMQESLGIDESRLYHLCQKFRINDGGSSGEPFSPRIARSTFRQGNYSPRTDARGKIRTKIGS